MSIVDITADPTPAIAGLTQDIADPAGDASPDVVDLTRPLSRPGQARAADPSAASATATAAIEASDQSVSTSTRPSFTITDAATACAVSRKTITRKLADLSEHGAAKDDDGVWRIPVEALLAVGLHPGRSLPSGPRPAAAPKIGAPTPRTEGMSSSGPVVASPRSQSQVVDVVTIPRDRWDDLRLRLARAEAEAAERALALADARLALRALTAVPTPTPRDPANESPVGPGAMPERSGLSTGNEVLPAAAGWVMGQVGPVTVGGPVSSAQRSLPAGDPGAAPAVTVVPAPRRKRRWWQSAAR